MVAKKGKLRKVQNRPAATKSSSWKSVKYVCGNVTANDHDIIKMLLADKLLMDLSAKLCPRCSSGALSKLHTGGPHHLKHRCNNYKCTAAITPYHLHPLFSECMGPQKQSLQMQSAMLLLMLHKVPQSTIHLVLDINHKAIEYMEKKLCRLCKDFVEKEEKNIVFGNKRTWVDVEADEATFDKRDISKDPDLKHLISKPNNTILWEHMGAMGWNRTEQSGRSSGRASLKRNFATAKFFSIPIRQKAIHDRVVHCKKRVKINGKYQWTSPKYVTMVTHKVPGSNKKLKVKSGTQIIDRAWRFLKDRIAINQNVKAGSSLLRAKLRSAQYDYWFKNSDLWLASGELCTEDAISFSAAISACEGEGQWSQALLLLASMHSVRVKANEIGFNAAISVCAKGTQWRMSLQLPVVMSFMQVIADEITFSAAISSCEKLGLWRRAIGLLAVSAGANEIAFGAAIGACTKGVG
ncbi:unnamed protein product [Symbiodinium sp. CCMP2592]|nr:unnamed protein product [Symbiodinium sp. CCMP2592]